MKKSNLILLFSLLLGLTLAGPTGVKNTMAAPGPALTANCGISLAAADFICNGQLNTGSLPGNVSVIYLLDQQGNVIASPDVSGTDFWDITQYATPTGSIFIPCENNLQADRRIIVY